MNRLAVSAIIGFLVALGASGGEVAGGQITKQGDAYLFRMRFTKGQKMSYTIKSSARTPDGKVSMSADVPMLSTVKDVKGKIATVQLDIGPMMMNGKAMNQRKQSMEIKIDERGKPVGAVGPAQNVSTQLPDKPLKVGGTFPSTNIVNLGGSQFETKATNKFLGFKRVGSRKVAVISTTATGTGAIQSKGNGMSYVDVADGSLVSMNLTQRMTMSGQPQPITSIITITRR